MISNDLLLKMKDPKFYLENFCKIKTKNREFLPFKLNEAQKDLYNTLLRDLAKRVIILKARQIGFSTAVCGFFYHDTIMNPGTTSVIIGYNREMTAELLEKIKLFYQTTPDEIKPTIHYNTRFEMSFPKIQSKIIVLPSNETVGRGYTINNLLCVSGNTEVYLENGSMAKVSDLIWFTPGTKIMNGSGGMTPIKYIVKKPNDKRMIKIKPVGSEAIVVTEDHKVLTREFKTGKPIWKPASDITVNDYLAFPWFQVRERFSSLDIPHVPNAIRRSSTITLDYDFGCFIGWYLAEGSIKPDLSSITLSIDKDEVPEVLRLSQKFLPYVKSIGVTKSKNSRTACIHLYGKDFANFIFSYFGRKQSKTLPDKAWYFGTQFMYGVLEGVFKGDGYFGDVRKIQLTNTNIRIINQIKKLLVSLRFGMSSIKKTTTIGFLPRYDLILSGPGNWKFRRKYGLPLPEYQDHRSQWKIENHKNWNIGWHSWRRGKEYYWSKVKSVSNAPYEDIVYDIVLPTEPHSFVTNAGVVHNCTELAMWEKAEEKMSTLEASVPVDGRIIIESTPNGIGNTYHEYWVSDNGYTKKDYGWWWAYTEEQIELIRKRINNPQKFSQEYGLEFLTSGRLVFDRDAILEQRKNILKPGDSIKWVDHHGVEHKTIVYVDDELRIYIPPIVGGLYTVGVDTSEGVEGGDYTAVTIIDRRTGEEVAFYRGLIAPDTLGIKLNTWGRKYNNALMVVEVNNHGLTTLTKLKELFYPSLYFRPNKFDTLSQEWSEKMGWRTTAVTKPLLIDDLNRSLRDVLLKFHSKEILDEMLTFVYNENNEMQPMTRKYHDDCIFSAGIAYQGFKVLYDKPLTQIDYQQILPQNFVY